MSNKDKLRSSRTSSGSSRNQGIPSRKETPDKLGNFPEHFRNFGGTNQQSTAGNSQDSPENSMEVSPEGSRSHKSGSSSLHRSSPGMPPSPRAEWIQSEKLPKVTRLTKDITSTSTPQKKNLGKMGPKILRPNFVPLNSKSMSVGNLRVAHGDDFGTKSEKISRKAPHENLVNNGPIRSFTDNNPANTEKFPRMFDDSNTPGMNGTTGVGKKKFRKRKKQFYTKIRYDSEGWC